MKESEKYLKENKEMCKGYKNFYGLSISKAIHYGNLRAKETEANYEKNSKKIKT